MLRYIKVVIIVFIFGGETVFPGCVFAAAQTIRVVLRCDDYGDLSSSRTAALLDRVVRECEACMTLGVIPFNKRKASPEDDPMNPYKVALMRDGVRDGHFEIALHGYTHAHRSPLEYDSEFKGLPLEEQRRMLSAGRAALEGMAGTDVRVFIPPWHSHDVNTLRAMRDAGLVGLSTEFGELAEGLSQSELEAFFCIPEGGDLWTIQTIIERARQSGDPAPVVTVLFHDYDFKQKGQKFITEDWLRNLFQQLKAQGDVQVTTMAAIMEASPGLTMAHLFDLNRTKQKMHKRAGFLRTFLRVDTPRLLPEGVLSSPAHLRHIKRTIAVRLWILTVLLLLLLSGVGFLLLRKILALGIWKKGNLFFRKDRNSSVILTYVKECDYERGW